MDSKGFVGFDPRLTGLVGTLCGEAQGCGSHDGGDSDAVVRAVISDEMW